MAPRGPARPDAGEEAALQPRRPAPRRRTTTQPRHRSALALLLVVGVLVLLLIATQTSFVWLLVPVVGVLVYAWVHGRATPSRPASPPTPPPDAAD